MRPTGCRHWLERSAGAGCQGQPPPPSQPAALPFGWRSAAGQTRSFQSQRRCGRPFRRAAHMAAQWRYDGGTFGAEPGEPPLAAGTPAGMGGDWRHAAGAGSPVAHRGSGMARHHAGGVGGGRAGPGRGQEPRAPRPRAAAPSGGSMHSAGAHRHRAECVLVGVYDVGVAQVGGQHGLKDAALACGSGGGARRQCPAGGEPTTQPDGAAMGKTALPGRQAGPARAGQRAAWRAPRCRQAAAAPAPARD